MMAMRSTSSCSLPIRSRPVFLVEARPIGIMNMVDCGEGDDKIIAVPKSDPRFDEILDLGDVNKHTLKEMQHFFETYKTIDDKVVVVNGFKDKQAALVAIERDSNCIKINLENNMNVTVKKLPESKAELTVTLPWEEWKDEMKHAVAGLAKEVKVSGFRPGKAPRDVIEKRFGKQALFIEAAEHAVTHSYPKALAEAKIEAIGQPEVKLEKFAENEILEYSVVTAVMPEVTLKPWKDDVKKVNAEFAKKKMSSMKKTSIRSWRNSPRCELSS